MSVVVFHLTSSFDDFFPGYPKAWYTATAGRYGVQLFFVISGFVILWTIGRASRWREFGISRFTRLYPPYWAALGLTTLWIVVTGAGALSPHFRITFPQFLANLTMVPAWFGFRPIDDVYWTLGVEMAFYVAISILYVCDLLRRDRIVKVLAAFWFLDACVLSALTKAAGRSLSENSNSSYLFVAGMACFLLWEGKARPRWLLWILFLQMPFVDIMRSSGIAAVVDIAIIVSIQLAVTGRLQVLETAVFEFFGRISYSLYLVHAAIGILTVRWLLERGVERNLAVALTIAMAILIAVALNRIVEQRVCTRFRSALTRRFAGATSDPGGSVAGQPPLPGTTR